MKLRDYQEDALKGICRELRAHRSTLAVLSTGLGKTVLFAHCSKIASKRVMVLAHRQELITQAASKIKMVTGEAPDIEMGDDWAQGSDNLFSARKVVVSSIQTQISGARGARRMTRFKPNDFSLLIIDEAHRALSESYMETIRYYQQNPALKLLGVTATPDRSDELAMGKIFESVAFNYGLDKSIENGWLVPIKQTVVSVKSLDFSKCRTTAGDFNQADLAQVMEFEENLHAVCTPTFEIAGDRKTLIFGASCIQAERMCEILNRHEEACAKYIDGKTPKDDRRRILQEYSSGKFRFLVNVNVFTEGYDEPAIELVVMAKPTKSRNVYAQQVGRGTRPLPGIVDNCEDAIERVMAIANSEKKSVEVLDFVGNSGRHELITLGDILGGDYSDAARKKVKKKMEDGEITNADIREELDAAELAVIREEEMRAAQKSREDIKAAASYSLSTSDPFSVLGLTPNVARGWERVKKPSEKMLAMLAKNGIDTNGVTFTKAKQLIGELIERSKKNMCSFKQAKVLKKAGLDTNVSFEEARKLIDGLAVNWKRKTG